MCTCQLLLALPTMLPLLPPLPPPLLLLLGFSKDDLPESCRQSSNRGRNNHDKVMEAKFRTQKGRAAIVCAARAAAPACISASINAHTCSVLVWAQSSQTHAEHAWAHTPVAENTSTHKPATHLHLLARHCFATVRSKSSPCSTDKTAAAAAAAAGGAAHRANLEIVGNLRAETQLATGGQLISGEQHGLRQVCCTIYCTA
jgi:hypothetical protein